MSGKITRDCDLYINILVYSRVPNTWDVLINRGGGGKLSKKLINGGLNKWGGQNFAKNGFLRYLQETSAITTVNSCR